MGARSSRRRACALAVAALLMAGCTGGPTEAGPVDDAPVPSPSGTKDPAAATEGGDPADEEPTPPGDDDTSGPDEAGEGQAGSDDSENAPAGTAATPTITSAVAADGTLSVSAGVNGVVEDGGTCTVTVTAADGAETTQDVAAFADATSTLCEPISVPAEGAGPWTVRVAYASAARSGTSDPVEVS